MSLSVCLTAMRRRKGRRGKGFGVSNIVNFALLRSCEKSGCGLRTWTGMLVCNPTPSPFFFPVYLLRSSFCNSCNHAIDYLLSVIYDEEHHGRRMTRRNISMQSLSTKL